MYLDGRNNNNWSNNINNNNNSNNNQISILQNGVESSVSNWIGMQFCDTPSENYTGHVDLKNDVNLDTGVTFSSFTNGELLVEKKKVEKLICMNANVGYHKTDKKGRVLEMDQTIWYNKKSMLKKIGSSILKKS